MNWKKTPWLSVIVAVGAFASGCGGGPGDYCVEQRDCEALNDADEEACAASIDAGADIAGIYNCSEQYDAVVDCVVAESSCEGTGNNKSYTTIDFTEAIPEDKCDNERANLDDCIDGASDRDNNNGNPGGD